MRAECVCFKCGACCKGDMGPIVFPSDVKTISANLGETQKSFLAKFCVLSDIPNNFGMEVYSLKMQEGKCIFLNNKNLCDIYDYRPYQCVNAPFNFLAKYVFWQHMSCIKKSDFNGIDSTKPDKEIFKELIDLGYKINN